jgi:hypothetical protein
MSLDPKDLMQEDVVEFDGRYGIVRDVLETRRSAVIYDEKYPVSLERVQLRYRMRPDAKALLHSDDARRMASESPPGWNVCCRDTDGSLCLGLLHDSVRQQPAGEAMRNLFEKQLLLPEAAIRHLEALAPDFKPKPVDPYVLHREELGLTEEQIAVATGEYYAMDQRAFFTADVVPEPRTKGIAHPWHCDETDP